MVFQLVNDELWLVVCCRCRVIRWAAKAPIVSRKSGNLPNIHAARIARTFRILKRSSLWRRGEENTQFKAIQHLALSRIHSRLELTQQNFYVEKRSILVGSMSEGCGENFQVICENLLILKNIKIFSLQWLQCATISKHIIQVDFDVWREEQTKLNRREKAQKYAKFINFDIIE